MNSLYTCLSGGRSYAVGEPVGIAGEQGQHQWSQWSSGNGDWTHEQVPWQRTGPVY